MYHCLQDVLTFVSFLFSVFNHLPFSGRSCGFGQSTVCHKDIAETNTVIAGYAKVCNDGKVEMMKVPLRNVAPKKKYKVCLCWQVNVGLAYSGLCSFCSAGNRVNSKLKLAKLDLGYGLELDNYSNISYYTGQLHL